MSLLNTRKPATSTRRPPPPSTQEPVVAWADTTDSLPSTSLVFESRYFRTWLVMASEALSKSAMM